MSFGGTSLSVYNPPPVTPPPAPNLSGINAPSPPGGFGATGGTSPIGTKPQSKPSQPTFLGASLAPESGAGQTSSPTLVGGGQSPANPSQVAALGARYRGRG